MKKINFTELVEIIKACMPCKGVIRIEGYDLSNVDFEEFNDLSVIFECDPILKQRIAFQGCVMQGCHLGGWFARQNIEWIDDCDLTWAIIESMIVFRALRERFITNSNICETALTDYCHAYSRNYCDNIKPI